MHGEMHESVGLMCVDVCVGMYGCVCVCVCRCEGEGITVYDASLSNYIRRQQKKN